MSRIQVIQIHPYDPTSSYVGGIGTYIRGIIKHTPAECEVSYVGVSTDPARYPVGRWHNIEVEGRKLRFFPVISADLRRRKSIPLSLRFTLGLLRYRARIEHDKAVLIFHRIEPSLPFFGSNSARILFLHGHNGKDFYNPQSEVRWSYFPRLYFLLEKLLIAKIEQVFIVRSDAIPDYQSLYPRLHERIHFIPTWVDDSSAAILAENEQAGLRQQLTAPLLFAPASKLLLFVGRFVSQKDPLLLLRAFHRLSQTRQDLHLVMIGSGELEDEIRQFIATQGLADTVHVLGPQPHQHILRWMNAADCLCMSSAFEGMPVVMVEALHCGLPVVSTNVGEAARLISNQQVGRLVKEASPAALSLGIEQVLAQARDRDACRRQASPYRAANVLQALNAHLGNRLTPQR
ncbi:glycosyltransferase [Massilia sp. MB5]|uniref:glycosyltransferase n=1 Tax=Massilia sp. MB5 TaxID=2919578 RepID=UPI001F0FB064|nr:glycosyltransferase [Massilia sp. MB5]UMR32532.1 glycosyltransferase [Massilia sp. MB5]